MLIGKLDFSHKLKSLSMAKFKAFWEEGDYEAKTKVNAENAAKVIGIKLPTNKKREV